MEFRILGPLEVWSADRSLPLGGPKQRAVVAQLILRANQVVTAEQLIDELWGEEPPETARNTLQTYVYRLRKVLGEERIESAAGAYRLRADPSEIDSARFEVLVREARRLLDSDPEGALARLDEALASWRGPAFSDLPGDPSLRGEVARLEDLRLVAIEQQISARLALGRHTTVIGALESLTGRYPLRERLWGGLMLALYRNGRQAEALDAYRRAREVLAEELGIDPSPELQQLHERILRQDPELVEATPIPRSTRSVAGELTPGSSFAGYRIDSVLGRGGMSVVYLAEHLSLRRKVALKVLAPQLAQDVRFRERFVRESRIAAGMEHPGIVPIYEAGEDDGLLFIAMRYVPGTDLGGLIRSEGVLPSDRVAWIVGELASALDAAHARGLVHRDVKPGNVLVVEGGGREGRDLVYLSDFGLTKRLEGGTGGLTQIGQFVGTVDYVAPEQIEGKPLDGRTDVYSLACLVFECLVGNPPFARDEPMAVLYAHLRERPPRLTSPELPAEADRVLARALSKRAADRFPTCGSFASAFREALGALAGEGLGEDGRAVHRSARRRTGVAALVATLAAGAIVFALASGGTPVADGGEDSPAPTQSLGPTSSSTPAPHFATVERALSSDETRLQSYLPEGMTDCLPLDRANPVGAQLAALVCHDEPVEVLYQLFPRLDLMDAAFDVNANMRSAPAGECATDRVAVTAYTVGGEAAGRVLCYTQRPAGASEFGPNLDPVEGESHIEWTDARLLIYAQAIRNDLFDLTLYDWWRSYSGPVIPTEDGAIGLQKDLPTEATAAPHGTYLLSVGPSDDVTEPGTYDIRLRGGAYEIDIDGSLSQTGALFYRKPDMVVFVPEEGRCNHPTASPMPARYGWSMSGARLTWEFRGGGSCAGPQVGAGRLLWIRA